MTWGLWRTKFIVQPPLNRSFGGPTSFDSTIWITFNEELVRLAINIFLIRIYLPFSKVSWLLFPSKNAYSSFYVVLLDTLLCSNEQRLSKKIKTKSKYLYSPQILPTNTLYLTIDNDLWIYYCFLWVFQPNSPSIFW